MTADTRIEEDSMGRMTIPATAYWGAQTQRAVENFPISGYRVGRPFIRALGLIKQGAAKANRDLGRLDPKLADLIVKAAREVIDGKLDDHFVLDIFQTGSGTSTNMNANEVISNRAIELAGSHVLVHAIGGSDPSDRRWFVDWCRCLLRFRFTEVRLRAQQLVPGLA